MFDPWTPSQEPKTLWIFSPKLFFFLNKQNFLNLNQINWKNNDALKETPVGPDPTTIVLERVKS